MAVMQLLTFLQIYIHTNQAERLTRKRYKYLWASSSPFTRQLLFVSTSAADKRGACSLLARITEVAPPLLQPRLAGTRTHCLTRSFPQQQLAQSPLAHPARQQIHSKTSLIQDTSSRQWEDFLCTHTWTCGLSWSLTKSPLAAPRSKWQHCCSTSKGWQRLGAHPQPPLPTQVKSAGRCKKHTQRIT